MITINRKNSVSIKRVVIVDPSLSDFIGHHAQYDISVLKACGEKNIPGCVLAHRSIDVSVDEHITSGEISVKKVFSEDMWGSSCVYELGVFEIRQFFYGCIASILFPSTAKNNLARFKRWTSGFLRKKNIKLNIQKPSKRGAGLITIMRSARSMLARRKIKLLMWIIESRAKAKAYVSEDSHLSKFFIYIALYMFPYGLYSLVKKRHQVFNASLAYRSVASKSFFYKSLYFIVIFIPKTVASLLLAIISLIIPALVVQIVYGVVEKLRLRNFLGSLSPTIQAIRLENPRYYLEARRGLDSADIKQGDLVYFHMVIGRNVLETALLCEYIYSKTGTPPVVLFRYPPAFLLLSDSRTARLAIRKFEYLFDFEKVRLASDSDRLIDEYGKVTYVPFELFPIPHGQAHTQERDNISSIKHNIKIASLGNARGEKGFIEIYYMMRGLAEKNTNLPVEFIIQANNPDSDAEPFVKNLEIEKFPFPVSIITESLDTCSYEALVSSADIILAPYWREVYSSRTSGVALEAIVAGKVLITTSDTWMSDQIEQWGAGLTVENKDSKSLMKAIERSVENIKALKIEAKSAGHAAADFHSGKSFIEHVTGNKLSWTNRKRDACFFYPWDNLFQYNSGASVRSSLMVRKIIESGWHVSVIGQVSRSINLPKDVTVFNYAEPLALFSNPIYLVDYIQRLFLSPRKLGLEDFQYRFKYWMRSRSCKLVINSMLRSSSAAIIQYPFLSTLVAPFAKSYSIPLIVDDSDVLGYQVDNGILRNVIIDHETRALNRADYPYCISKEDQSIFKKYGCETQIIKNSIDIRTFRSLSYSEAKKILIDENIQLPSEKFGLFVGSAHPPNFVAAKRIELLSKHKQIADENISFVIVGGCAARDLSITSQNISRLGLVSSIALKALYSLASFVLIPLESGTGSSLKTLEAFAYGKAVIGTETAFRTFDVVNSRHCIISNDYEKYPNLIINLMRNDVEREALEANAKLIAEGRDYRITYNPVIDFIEAHFMRYTNGVNLHERMQQVNS